VQFKLGRKLTAYYDALVRTVDTEEYRVRPIAVTWGLDTNLDRHEETDDVAKMQAEAVRRGVATPFLQLMADCPERSMCIRVSPLDTRFIQLVRLSDPWHVRAMLAEACAPGSAAADQGRIGEYTVTYIKYRPGKRHVLRYDPVDPGKAGTVFAKLYIGEDGARVFRREDGARVFRVASKAADWLAEHGEGVNGLRPLAYVAEDAVVLYPRVVGMPLSDYARRSSKGVAPWLQRAGAALCNLHQLPVTLAGPLGPPHDFAAEIGSIAKKSNHVPALLPQLSAIEALLDRARELHERLPQEPPTFTHADLKSEHFWVTATGLTVVDFDSSRLADPALDMGQFLADWQFCRAAHDQVGLEEGCESFLAGYAPSAPKERLVRARLYEAVELIKYAVRRVRPFEYDCASRTGWLIDRAWAILNDLQRRFSSPARPLSAQSWNMFQDSLHAQARGGDR
jgi:aminoglycoside phosphotransferase (APT) family kinase protein